MRHVAIAIFSALMLTTVTPAVAGCYADYKARRDNPLQLHYGVAEILGECRKDDAREELKTRLTPQGWSLLTVLGLFDETGLETRKPAAAEYFLRY